MYFNFARADNAGRENVGNVRKKIQEKEEI
jgi:hypothetical protein